MKIEKSKVANYNGKDIHLFRLFNSSGHFIECINYGASLIRISVFGKENLVLSYPKIEDYFSDPYYLGCTVGRVANRISNGRFLLDGKQYELTKNDGKNTNHGGEKGFNRKVFDAEIQGDKVIFKTVSLDGEEGFPGNLSVKISYTFSDENEINMEYEVTTDEKTPVNLTNHSYFNLAGKDDILDHELTIYASDFLQMNQEFLPTGKLMKIDQNTAFDFSNFKKIGKNLLLKNEIIEGYNTYFILPEEKKLKTACTLLSEKSGIYVELKTTMPGFILYTGDYLSAPFQRFSGVCLEAQYHPDAVNQPNFPCILLTPDDIWQEQIIYKISNRQ